MGGFRMEKSPSSGCRHLLPAGGEKGIGAGVLPPSPRSRGEGPGRGMRGNPKGIFLPNGITPTRRFAATSPLKGEVGASTINITRRRAHAGFGNGG